MFIILEPKYLSLVAQSNKEPFFKPNVGKNVNFPKSGHLKLASKTLCTKGQQAVDSSELAVGIW